MLLYVERISRKIEVGDGKSEVEDERAKKMKKVEKSPLQLFGKIMQEMKDLKKECW